MIVKLLKTVAILSTTVLISGCFETRPTAPPTKAEFHLACVNLLVQGRSSKNVSVSPSEIVPACKCLAEQIEKSNDPEFQVRVSRAFIDADGDVKAVEVNIKALMNSFPVDSAEYLIEKSKIDEFERRAPNCNKH